LTCQDLLHPHAQRCQHSNTHYLQTMLPSRYHSTKLKTHPLNHGGMPTKHKKWSKIYPIQDRRTPLHYKTAHSLICTLTYVQLFRPSCRP
jgi:hypothetical protein